MGERVIRTGFELQTSEEAPNNSKAIVKDWTT
jgi:hypothetical protein